MNVELTEVERELIENVARENGFTDFEVQAYNGSSKGDNYLGVIKTIVVGNKARALKLILKSAKPGDETFRKSAPVHEIYNREIYIYEEVFEEFKRFQDEHNITNPFTGHAKFYGKCNKEGSECLIMENLMESGYKLCNRKKPMDAEHIAAVFVEYARFHAVSLAMRHKKPDSFHDLTKNIVKSVFQSQLGKKESMEAYVKGVVANGMEAIADDPVGTGVLLQFESKFPDYMMEDVMDPELCIVITHGDSWCNNLMFKYEDAENPTTPTKMCLLDWQISRRGSPAADLSYFFLAHSPKEILYDYEKYLKLYHITVCKNLEEFSCDPEKVFPYSLLERHWKLMVKYGFYMSLLMIRLMNYDDKQVPDVDCAADPEGDFLKTLYLSSVNSGEYNRRIRDLVEFLIDNNFLDWDIDHLQ